MRKSHFLFAKLLDRLAEIGWDSTTWQIRVIFYVSVPFFAFLDTLRWAFLIYLLRRGTISAVAMTWRIAVRTKEYGLEEPYYLPNMIAMCVATASFSILLKSHTLAICLLSAAALYHMMTRSLRLPLVLFCASSTKESLELFQRLVDGSTLLRIVALLDESAATRTALSRVASTLDTDRDKRLKDSFRLSREHEEQWRDVVADLMKHVALIIVDTRLVSAAVEWELSHIRENEYEEKTVVVMEKGGQSAVVGAVELDEETVGNKFRNPFEEMIIKERCDRTGIHRRLVDFVDQLNTRKRGD